MAEIKILPVWVKKHKKFNKIVFFNKILEKFLLKITFFKSLFPLISKSLSNRKV